LVHPTYRLAYLQAMNAVLRMLDAAANRAREALRVMEDAARFALDDAELVETIKGLRHDLRTTLDAAGLDRTLLSANRDTPGDVGTGISTPSEGARAGIREIVLAAGARLGEALRTVEECVKAAGGRAAPEAPGVEALRYRAYAVEQRLVLAMGSGRARQWRLCVLVTEALCRRPWDEVARGAISGGADCLQLREKELEGGELLRRCRRLVEMTRDAGVSVVVNDRPDAAVLSGADGVHLGQTDLPVREVRALAGAGLLVGVSASTIAEARRAVRDGADYCGLGPIYPTLTKHKPEVRGPGLVSEYLGDPVLAGMPHLAIGGITATNAGELAGAGCRGVAVSSAVCGADDPAGVCRALLGALGA
jgi:thiamine-phosphate pyrophosphorylase